MKYLYFSNAGGEDAINDIICVPVSQFRGFLISAADAVSLGMYFSRTLEGVGAGEDEPFDLVDLVITTGTAKTVCRAIVEAINFGKDPFIVVADDTSSVYLDADVTGVAAITIGT